MRARFLHASQLRLDAPMTGFRDIDDTTRSRLRDATIDTLDRIVDTACSQHVDAVLFTGDLFAGPQHGVRAQLAFSRAVERLADHGIAVVAVAGPGDAGDPWFPSVASWPTGVAVVGLGGRQTIGLRHRGESLVTIEAVAAGSPATTDGEPAGAGLRVAVVGGLVEDVERWAGFDHVAHGGCEVHHAKRLGNGWITTPGTAQHLSSRGQGDRAGEVEIFTVDSTVQQSEPERLAVGAVRMIRLIIDVDPLLDLNALRTELEARADALATEAGERTLVVSADLIGTGIAHRALQASNERRVDLLETLRSRSRSVAPSLWWASLDLKTTPPSDLRAIDRADFSALLTQTGSELALAANQPIRDGWLRDFPSDLQALAFDEDSSDTRWAEARRIADAALITSERTQT